MFQKILVCSDGSHHALAAARLAARLAKRFDAELLLLTVFDEAASIDPYFSILERSIGRDTILRYIEQTQDDIIERTQSALKAENINSHAIRQTGHPVETIAMVAERESADLVVVGSRGLGRFERLRLGSVSQGVLHHTSCSVLIARGGGEEPRHILLAADGTQSARSAACHAIALAEAFSVPLTVLNVCERLTDFAAVSSEDIKDIANATAVRMALAHPRGADGYSGALQYTVHQEIGRPAATILKYADEHDSDLLVLGSRNLDAVGVFLMGGVSDAVVSHSAQSVLIAR